ncbi:MAG: FUSC family membrane protein [Cyclobacteriaceae bacterium]
MIAEHYKEFVQFIKSADFSKAVMGGIAITVPIVLGIELGHFEVGLAIASGAFWSSPSNVSGSYRNKVYGILFSTALVMVVSFIGGHLNFEAWLIIPVLGALAFAIAMISVYGFRASLISLCGLLALVLSFAHDPEELAIWQFALLIGVGGLWYLLLATLLYRINPRAQTEEFLYKAYWLTADFLNTRGQLIGEQSNRKTLQAQLFTQQSELMELHSALREILIRRRKDSGQSIYSGKRLLVFTQLVEILETAVAHPVQYDKMDELFKTHPEYVQHFQTLIFEMSRQLQMIAAAGSDATQLPPNGKLNEYFSRLREEISTFGNESNNNEGYLMLQNLMEYQESQFKKIKEIKWLLGNPDTDSIEFIAGNVARRFIVRQDYDPRLLLRNLSFRSSIFKHSLRLSVTLMIGYALGTVFDFQNPYWILLTIIVIMRPSYGLTKTRSKDRIIGTLIGSAIATGVVFWIQDPYVYGALGVVTLVIAFAMLQKNYRASATFVTLSVIFIYAITQPDILTVIQYRIWDTLLGAGLSLMALLWLWPVWSFLEIRQNMENSVKANKDFLNELSLYYQHKGKMPTSCKIARKDAFLETSNLSAAFQRMAQEPPSKQKNLDKIYEMVELNHVFLSSLSSLSSYIQNHPTTSASEEFITAIAQIDKQLEHVLKMLKEEERPYFDREVFVAKKLMTPTADGLSGDRERQEAHLIWEQLRWLHSLSNGMGKLVGSL